MKLQKLEAHWQRLATTDPFWAVLSWEDKRGNKWNKNDFFATGDLEISQLLQYLNSLQIIANKDMALDFGCGLGRLTEALADHFTNVVGVDIAPAMIEQAQQFSTHTNCSYVLNEADNLHIFPDNTFTCIYSRLTFQHITPNYTKKYLSEFARILRPGGILIFGQPCITSLPPRQIFHSNLKNVAKQLLPISIQNGLRRTMARLKRSPVMELHSIPPTTITKWVIKSGLQIRAQDTYGDLGPSWVCYRYVAIKPYNV